MVKVHSSLTTDQITQIKATGIPVYRFLKMGVEAKLDEMRSEKMLDRKLADFEKRQFSAIESLKNEFQENLIEAIDVINNLVGDQIKRDSELKEKFNLALQTIMQKLS